MLLVSTKKRGVVEQQLCLASERESWIEEEQRKPLVIKEFKIIMFEQGVPG